MPKIRGTRLLASALKMYRLRAFQRCMTGYIGVSYTVGKLLNSTFQYTLRNQGDTNVYSCTRNGRPWGVYTQLAYLILQSFCGRVIGMSLVHTDQQCTTTERPQIDRMKKHNIYSQNHNKNRRGWLYRSRAIPTTMGGIMRIQSKQ